MATSYKTFLNNDITSTKTLLHEAVPLTGAWFLEHTEHFPMEIILKIMHMACFSQCMITLT